MLALFAAKPNRSGRAWWIWAPLLGVAALLTGLGAAFVAFLGSSGVDLIRQAFAGLSFAFAALWLLMPYFSGKGTPAAFFGSLLTIMFGTVIFGIAVNGIGDSPASLIAFGLIGLNAALAWSLAAISCRKSYSPLRFLVWLIVWLLAAWLVTASPFIVIALFQVGVAALGAFVAVLVAVVAVFVTLLPFLVLTFAEPFYRARFLAYLGQLPAERATPEPAPMPAPAA